MALQRMFVTVAYSDGHVSRSPISPKVQMFFERTYKVSVARLTDDPAGQTRLYQLAWESERANSNGAVILDFESWVGTIDAIDVDLEDVVRPTGAAPSAASSPSSPSPPA